MGTADISQQIKSFIMQEFLPGESPDNLQGDTPLISAGILDSIATLKVVAFLEEKFNIQLEAHEAGAEFLNTIDDMANLVASKK